MILDTTAANRHMWSVKNPENVIFMDREPGLRIKPDVIADFTFIPFKDGLFDFVVYDPPHLINTGGIRTKWLHSDPFEGRTEFFERGSYPRKTYGSWWGAFSSAGKMREGIALATDEIHRVTKPHGMLHFKFNNAMIRTMSVVASFGQKWIELYRTDRQTGTHVSDSRTYWILFQKRNIPGAFRGKYIQIDIDEPGDVEISPDAKHPHPKSRLKKKPKKKIDEYFTEGL